MPDNIFYINQIVRCIKTDDGYFTAGKEYQIKGIHGVYKGYKVFNFDQDDTGRPNACSEDYFEVIHPRECHAGDIFEATESDYKWVRGNRYVLGPHCRSKSNLVWFNDIITGETVCESTNRFHAHKFILVERAQPSKVESDMIKRTIDFEVDSFFVENTHSTTDDKVHVALTEEQSVHFINQALKLAHLMKDRLIVKWGGGASGYTPLNNTMLIIGFGAGPAAVKLDHKSFEPFYVGPNKKWKVSEDFVDGRPSIRIKHSVFERQELISTLVGLLESRFCQTSYFESRRNGLYHRGTKETLSYEDAKIILEKINK